MARRKRTCIWLRVGSVLLSLLYLTVAAVVASGTYAWSHSRTGASTGTFAAVKGADVFQLSGSFDEDRWLAGRGSGLEVTNRTDSELWVYFSVSGSLRDLVKPVDPLRLGPGEKKEIPLEVDQHSDLALLSWRNQGRVFRGSITARIFNNFASDKFDEISVSATRLYAVLVEEGPEHGRAAASSPGEDVTPEGIRSVGDLRRLVEQNQARGAEIDQLRTETEKQQGIIASLEEKINSLLTTIDSLTAEKSLLNHLVDFLKAKLDSATSAPPAEPPAAAPPPAAGSPPDGGAGGKPSTPPGQEPGSVPGQEPANPADPGTEPGTPAPPATETGDPGGQEPGNPPPADGSGPGGAPEQPGEVINPPAPGIGPETPAPPPAQPSEPGGPLPGNPPPAGGSGSSGTPERPGETINPPAPLPSGSTDGTARGGPVPGQPGGGGVTGGQPAPGQSEESLNPPGAPSGPVDHGTSAGDPAQAGATLQVLLSNWD